MSHYPFTPALLDALPEELAELFRGLEDTLLDEICSRLALKDQLNEVTVQAIRALRSHGIDTKEIEKAIRNTSGISEKKLNELFDDVIARNQKYYTSVIDMAGLTKPDILVNAATIEAIRTQTLDEFHNITASMGFLVDKGRTILPPARAYQWALDSAVMQIQTGAISYNQAIKSAVQQLAGSGLKTVDYESGHVDQIDVAARRAVMTGVNQLCDQYTNQSAEYLGTRYFEVSAHSGARDKPGPSPWSSHKDWQGKVYYQSENGDGDPLRLYEDLVATTGYGYVDGLTGANCRHHKYPFIPGVSERTYTDEQLAHIDDGLGCEFDGKKYTAYEATQMQRRIERQIRAQKKLKNAYEKSGLTEDARAASVKLRRLNTKYRDFSKAAGLPEQPERTKVLHTDAKSEAAASAAKAVEWEKLPINAGPTANGGFQPRYTDVTEKWRAEATPNSNAVQDLQEYTANGVTYKADGHNVVLDYSPHEKEIAELLEKEFGGEMYMVPRVNEPSGISTPDFLFRGQRFDLKSISGGGKSTIYNAVAKKAQQAENFILDVTESPLSMKEIEKQSNLLFSSSHTKFVKTIILLKNGSVLKVLMRNK